LHLDDVGKVAEAIGRKKDFILTAEASRYKPIVTRKLACTHRRPISDDPHYITRWSLPDKSVFLSNIGNDIPRPMEKFAVRGGITRIGRMILLMFFSSKIAFISTQVVDQKMSITKMRHLNAV
jgi:hypothetical protein